MSFQDTLIPLHKVVAAAIIDSWEDRGKVEQMYFHWAARELKDMNRKILKFGIRKEMLPINGNTRTATLPIDFQSEVFVGIIDLKGEKVPLSLNTKLTDSKNIEYTECIDRCPKCNQDKAICEDLQVTEEVNLIVINGTSYEQNIIKKLYPNGDYYLETSNPVYNTITEEVEFITSKQFIANLDLKPCGCLETTSENLTTLQSCCPDVYGCYYAPCSCDCDTDLGGYKIFEESNLIQVDYKCKATSLYLEYRGFLPKVNGQLQLPEVAFEAVVEGVKFRSIKNRSNQPLSRIQLYRDFARVAKSDMIRVLGRVSLSHIIEAAMTTPKFDIKRERWYECFSSSTTSTTSSSMASSSTDTASQTTNTTTVVEVIRDRISFGKIKFTVGDTGNDVMVEGATNFIITNNGVAVANVMTNSVNVNIDNVPIVEVDYADAFSEDQLEYKVLYGTTQTTIYFNQGAMATQKYKITYAKTI